MKKTNVTLLLLVLPLAYSSQADMKYQKKEDNKSAIQSVRKGELEKFNELANQETIKPTIRDQQENSILGIAVNNSLFTALLDSLKIEKKRIQQVKKKLQLGNFQSYMGIINSFLQSEKIKLKHFGSKFKKSESDAFIYDFLLGAAVEVVCDARWYKHKSTLQELINKLKKYDLEVAQKIEAIQSVEPKKSIFTDLVKEEYKKIVQTLVSKHINQYKGRKDEKDRIGIYQVTYEKNAPLVTASRANNEEIVKLLLSCDVTIEDDQQAVLDAALLAAVQEDKNPTMVEWLVNKGANPSVKDEYDYTTINIAIFKTKNLQILQKLLTSEKADINQIVPHPSSFGDYHPIEKAIVIRDHEILKLLLEKVDKQYINQRVGDFLKMIIREGYEDGFDLIRGYSDEKAINNWYQAHQQSSGIQLHYAVTSKNIKMAEWLLASKELRVNPQEKLYNMRLTPLHVAVKEGDMQMTELLLKYDQVDCNSEDKEGNTPLHLACDKGFKNMIQLLFARTDLKINHQNKFGCTPFYEAVEAYARSTSQAKKEECKEIIELLLGHNEIKPNIETYSRETASKFIPLHLLIPVRNEGMVRWLLNNKKIHISMEHKEKGIKLAVQSGHTGMLKLLLEHPKFDFNILEDQEFTSLINQFIKLAQDSNQLALVPLLEEYRSKHKQGDNPNAEALRKTKTSTSTSETLPRETGSISTSQTSIPKTLLKETGSISTSEISTEATALTSTSKTTAQTSISIPESSPETKGEISTPETSTGETALTSTSKTTAQTSISTPESSPETKGKISTPETLPKEIGSISTPETSTGETALTSTSDVLIEQKYTQPRRKTLVEQKRSNNREVENSGNLATIVLVVAALLSIVAIVGGIYSVLYKSKKTKPKKEAL